MAAASSRSRRRRPAPSLALETEFQRASSRLTTILTTGAASPARVGSATASLLQGLAQFGSRLRALMLADNGDMTASFRVLAGIELSGQRHGNGAAATCPTAACRRCCARRSDAGHVRASLPHHRRCRECRRRAVQRRQLPGSADDRCDARRPSRPLLDSSPKATGTRRAQASPVIKSGRTIHMLLSPRKELRRIG